MSKRLVSLLVLASSLAFAASDVHPAAIDAFLSRREAKPMVDARELTAAGRAVLANGLVTSVEPRFGVPTFFWSAPVRSVRSYRDMGLTPAEAARRYLLTHAELYRGDAARWAEAQVTQVHDLEDGGAVIVTVQQRIKGVRVFRDELKVIMNSKLELVALAGYLTPQTKVQGAFALTSESAIASAYQSVTGHALALSELTKLGLREGGYQAYRAPFSAAPIRTRPVYFPLPEGVVPGFYVELEALGEEGESLYFSFVVSAVDGAVLYRKNLTADAFTYKVWASPQAPFVPFDGPQGTDATPHPTGTPSQFSPTAVAQELVTLDNAGLSTNDPWLDANATQTLGNNVRAYADITRNNGYTAGSDPVAVTTAPGVFGYSYDVNGNPEANTTDGGVNDQRRAAITQLFYNDNFFHDWYYDDGFDEAAGNAQASNLGRGGVGGDVLLAEAQDYSGRSNANMSTPSDGASPRMQMYIFDGADSATVTANTGTPQNFNTYGAEFGAQVYTLTAPVMIANDGDSTPTDSCATWSMANATGKIVLIDRGTCTFVQKAEKAQAAGAVGVIIANNQTGGPMQMPGTSPGTTIPVMSVSQNSGNTLKNLINSGGGTLTVTMSRAAATNKDGTLDNGVVAHEWGHYISNRLIGDGNGISNTQAVGMGEGWADFHAALMITRASDSAVASNSNWGGAYGLAGWAGSATDADAYYFGFRRYPLSYEFSRNPLTFKHIADGERLPTTAPLAFGASGADNSEVHNTGEVWAVMLWDCYVMLLRDSRYTFPQAQARMKRYLVAAYKATALMPTFVDARDALLAVAAANDMQDFASFWQAFARRGLGMGAVAPDRDSQNNTPVTESFTVGNAVTITEVTLDDSNSTCDRDGVLDANESGVLTIKLKNTGTGSIAANVAVTTAASGVTFPSGAMQTMPQTAPFGVATLVVPVALGDVAGVQGGMFTITVTDASLARGPVTQTAMFRMNYDLVPESSRLDDVESPSTTWSVGSDQNLTTGSNFRIFQSTATQHFWFGPNPSSPADTWLISPSVKVGAGPATITFKHRWDFEMDATQFYDGAVIEVSNNNGGSWTDIGASATPGYSGQITADTQSSNPLRSRRGYVGKSAGYPAFITETVDLGTRFAGQNLKLRFRIGSDDAAAAKGWEIDDIQFSGIDNKPFTSVTSDPNSCTNGAPTSTIGPNLEVFERETVTLVGSATDPDNDPLTIAWTQVGGPLVTITNNTFVAPDVTADTLITVQMTATDGRAVTLPKEQQILVKNLNRAPIATVPATQETPMAQVTTVLGSGSDPDGDAVTYAWTQVSGPTVELTGIDTDTVTFTAPTVLVSEVVRLQLVVSDGVLSSEPAVVDVVVKNPNPPVNSINPTPMGCGCATGVELLPLALLGLVLRSRRRR